MATIGTLTKRPDGAYLGALSLKSYTGRVFFQPDRARRNPASPDFRIFGASLQGGRLEMGAAWVKTRTDGQGTYVSVKLDFPELPTPIYATLGVMAMQDDPDLHAVI